MVRILPALLAMLLGCASAQISAPPRAEEISTCWTKFGDVVLQQTGATLAQRQCDQECEATGENEELAAGDTEGLADSDTEEPRMCERECEAPSESEEIEIASAAWLQTGSECHPHAQVLARRTRAERQQAEISSRQQDWSNAPPIDDYARRMWELDAEHDAKMAELEAQGRALMNESTPGEVEVRERMGKISIVLKNLVTPVIREQEIAPVYTVELLLVLSDDSAEVGISPKYRHSNEWSWLKCHDVGLWKNEPWTFAPNVAGSDGQWTHIEAGYNGDVRDSGLSEWVTFNVSLDLLRELAAAEHSGGQVCRDKFELSAEQKAAIASFADHPGSSNSGSAN
jgi:hypothetical protein